MVPMSERKDVVPVWVGVTAVAVFLVHALNYLYFFVDDEGIPFVYAQNLLNGRGLSYNALEGRLEGYSDFLHVLWSSVILAAVHTVHAPKVSVFFVGKAASALCGVGILILIWFVLRRSCMRPVSGMTALGILALAAPIALWSCSSLEAVPFALIATALIVALVLDRDRWAAIAAVLLVLERIDGFAYAGLLVGAFTLTASAGRRREMMRRIVFPSVVVFLGYHGWRWWYFNDLVPAPVEAKILYKLLPHQHVVVKRPDRAYPLQFIGAYGWPAAMALLAAAVYALKTGTWMRRLTIAAVPLTIYVSIVGDWMFGFRFFIPLLPVFALIVANGVNGVATISPRIAGALCVTVVIYSGFMAARFSDTFVRVEQTPGFLHSPSRDLHRFFGPYYGLYVMARHLMFPGDVVAYNQAGFVPFMLDVNNIDDLGICSRFPADVPSTDIYFTEVGRYAPLTDKRTLRPVHAYFLYEHVQFVMSRTDILVRANNATIPSALFGGLYELLGTDPQGLNAIYRRNDTIPVHIAPRLFTENVAHVSYLRAVRLGQSVVDSKDYVRKLPFLRDEAGAVTFTGRTDLAFEFSDAGEHVYQISIQELRASSDVNVHLRLVTAEGSVVAQTDVNLAAGRGRSVLIDTPRTVAKELVLTIEAGTTGQLSINDLRVEGQRRALRRYVIDHLQFPHTTERD